MGKKILAILGSPHLTGKTASMMNCAIEAAAQAGWESDIVHLYQKHILFCNGCRTCLNTGNCVQKDDIEEIVSLLRNCDVVIMAAPTYWANVPAVVKNLYDRLLGTAMEDTKTFPKPRLSSKQKYLLLTACNTPNPFAWLCGQSRGALRAMDEFFRTSGMTCMGKVVFSNAKEGKEIPKSVRNKLIHYWR